MTSEHTEADTASSTETAPSTLAYLFCSQMAPPVKRTKGHPCPADGVIVGTEALAVMLGIAAALSLREAGAFTVEKYDVVSWYAGLHDVKLYRADVSPTWSGIEGRFYGACLRSGSFDPVIGETLTSAVRGSIPITKRPFETFIGVAINDAIDHGYLVKIPVHRGVMGRVRHQLDYRTEPVVDSLAAAKPTFETFLLRWNAFYLDERPLYDAMKTVLRRAIKNSKPVQESDSI